MATEPCLVGGVMVDDVENFEIDMANPAVIEWFERMQKAREDGLVYVPTQADGGTSAFFGSGQAAMTIESTGLIGSVDTISEGKFTAETGFLPSGPGGRWVPSGGNGLSIIAGKSPEVTEAAWEFIKYLQIQSRGQSMFALPATYRFRKMWKQRLQT